MTVSAQNQQNSNQNSNAPESSNSGYDPFSSRSPLDEMRAKLRLKYAEKEFKENLARAEEAEKISAELLKNYEKAKSLNQIERKKLEHLEKLIKNIRKASGGGNDEISLEQKPANLNDALKLIAEESVNLNVAIKKTSRVVVSAAVIEKSNTLLELIKIARTFQN
jgi:hypothetical protein